LVDLPNQNDRKALIKHNLAKIKHKITGKDLIAIAKKLDGYSGSDIVAITKSASYGPIRKISKSANWMTMDKSKLPAVTKADFELEIKSSKPSFPSKDRKELQKWCKNFGTD
jgi:SpoVK/Ycf46/Vps4 family AAA+-type ATPase